MVTVMSSGIEGDFSAKNKIEYEKTRDSVVILLPYFITKPFASIQELPEKVSYHWLSPPQTRISVQYIHLIEWAQC